jgi:hypothetical protein
VIIGPWAALLSLPERKHRRATLSAASTHFAALWGDHEIAALHETHKTIEHL